MPTPADLFAFLTFFVLAGAVLTGVLARKDDDDRR